MLFVWAVIAKWLCKFCVNRQQYFDARKTRSCPFHSFIDFSILFARKVMLEKQFVLDP